MEHYRAYRSYSSFTRFYKAVSDMMTEYRRIRLIILCSSTDILIIRLECKNHKVNRILTAKVTMKEIN